MSPTRDGLRHARRGIIPHMWTFNFVSAVSAVLCAAAVALWVRSYYVGDCVSWANGDQPPKIVHWGGRPTVLIGSSELYAAMASRGRFGLFWVSATDEGGYYSSAGWSHWGLMIWGPPPGRPPEITERVLSAGRFQARNHVTVGQAEWGAENILSRRYQMMILPFWPACLLFAAAPTRRLQLGLRRRRERRLRPGFCLQCGYDLRATPEPGGALLDRCPECGVVEKFKGVQ